MSITAMDSKAAIHREKERPREVMRLGIKAAIGEIMDKVMDEGPRPMPRAHNRRD